MKPKKSEVFDSRTIFPAMYHLCVEEANKLGLPFISFNGMVFEVTQRVPEYRNIICMYEEVAE